LLACLAGAPFLISEAARRGAAADVIGACVFAFTACLLYLTSTVYHAFPRGRSKEKLQVLDHGAIFLLIAGTYTPFTLGVLRGAWGWSLLALVWSLAGVGIVFKALAGIGYERFSTALYLLTGWVGLLAIGPLWASLPAEGLVWLLAGGVAYTVGVFFYTLESIRHSHFIWHLFVLAGTACHFVAVLDYAI
jgi:hemolysin III